MDPEDEVVEGQEDETLEISAGENEGEGPEGAGDEHVDAEGEDEGQVDGEPARKPSRAQSRIQTLTNTLKEEKAERQRIDRELADLRAEQRARMQQAQQETPEARATRRALMDPMEVMREDLRESEQRTQGLLHQQALAAQETGDRLEYTSLMASKPNLKKFEAEVEKIRLEQQARNIFVPRKVLLELAVGRAAMAAADKAGSKVRQQGLQRIAAQQSRPASSKGDSATQRGKQGDSAEKRLENVPI